METQQQTQLSGSRYPDFWAGLASFILPGLGQIWQGWRWRHPGRLIKGVVFFLVLHGMFFYGQALGQWKNVFLPQYQQCLDERLRLFGIVVPDWLANVWWRPAYAAQFWMGISAWPAVWNYCFPESKLFAHYQRSPGALGPNAKRFEREHDIKKFHKKVNEIQLRPDMGKWWDLGLLYTMLAGVLNLLVIYEAWSGPFEGTTRPGSSAQATPAPSAGAS